MACTCINDTVQMVKDEIAESVSGAESIRLRAVGNALAMNLETGKSQLRYCVEVTGHYMAPKKTGGMKRQNKTVSVVANYCPFCGVKCEPDGPEAD